MKLLSKTRNKIILIVAISILVFVAWESGLEKLYAQALIGTSNVVIGVFKSDTHIELEEIHKGYQFQVHTVVTGRKGSFPQEVGGLLQPFVIILSWQIFLFLILNTKTAFKSFVTNLLIFLLIQTFFLFILTGYYNSDTNKFIFNSMLDTFYIFTLILIIKDNLLYKVFGYGSHHRKYLQVKE